MYYSKCNKSKKYKKAIYTQSDFNTYVFDLETYTNSDNIAIPYAVGLARLNKMKTGLGEHINSSDSLLEDMSKRLLSEDFIKVFVGENCINEMSEHIANLNSNRNITLIGHNASGFDSFLIKKEFRLTKAPVCSGKKILSVTISNPYTPETSMKNWRNEKR